jgi:hypothetical protein
MHPVLTFGLLIRVRRAGGVKVSALSDLNVDRDLSCGRDTLANGSIGTFALGDVTVELQ